MKTMQKNKGLKKRGKGLALGICAAILGENIKRPCGFRVALVRVFVRQK